MIPHSDDLFPRYFDPWYDDSDRARRCFQTTRPDILTTDISTPSPLTLDAQTEVAYRIETILKAAKNDWGRELGLSGEPDLHWIETIDRHYDRQRIKELIEQSDPKDFSNAYLVVCCEFGALLGHVLKAHQPRLLWHYGWPYWESDLRDPQSNSVIPPFHWAVKKMSDYGVDDRFWEKVPMCISLLDKKE